MSGASQPANQVIHITASLLAQTSYQAGIAANTLMARANDGTQWGAWASFTVTGQPPVNTPAVVIPVNTIFGTAETVADGLS